MQATRRTSSQTTSTISVEELTDRQSRGETPQLIDVRSESEYALGHIPGTANIPLDTLDTRVEDISRTAPVILICQKGGRATQASAYLKETHRCLLVLEGGTEAWIRAGKPLVKTTHTDWSIERQIRLIAGSVVFVSTLMSLMVRPAIFVALFVGAALTVTALINWCGLGILLAKMPWNRIKSIKVNHVSKAVKEVTR